MRAAVQSAHLIQREAGMRPALSRPQKVIGREFSTPTRAQSSPAEVAADEPIPPGCSRYTVRICKPLGIVLEETDGLLRVGDVQAGGNAERHNETANADSIIRTNDQLIAVSGYTRTGQAQVRDRIRALIHSFNSLAHSLTLAVLRGCSLASYNDITVQGGEKMVRIMVGGQPANKRFDIVVSAISSHLAGMDVTLEFQRCE